MDREIQLADEVKNINGNDIMGFVIAKYPILSNIGGPAIICIDVRTDEKIYYGSPITNWKTVRKVEDIE